MPFTHCQIFVDDAGTTPFTFPAGTVSAKAKCIGRGFAGAGQNGGGGGGYGESLISSPILGVDAYQIVFSGDGSVFRPEGNDPIAMGAHAIDYRGGGIATSCIGDTTNFGGDGAEAGIGTGGCGGGGCGGPAAGGTAGQINVADVGGEGGFGNGGENLLDLTEGIGPTRVYIRKTPAVNDEGRGGKGGDAGQNGANGNFPGGGGGGQGDSPPSGPGAGALGVVVVLYTVASFVPKVIIV